MQIRELCILFKILISHSKVPVTILVTLIVLSVQYILSSNADWEFWILTLFRFLVLIISVLFNDIWTLKLIDINSWNLWILMCQKYKASSSHSQLMQFCLFTNFL